MEIDNIQLLIPRVSEKERSTQVVKDKGTSNECSIPSDNKSPVRVKYPKDLTSRDLTCVLRPKPVYLDSRKK